MAKSRWSEILIFSCVFCAQCARLACAAEQTPKRWSAGIGAIYADNPYQGTAGHDVLVIPFVSFRGSLLNIQGPQVSWLLKKWEQSSLSGVVEYRFGGYDAKDSDRLRGMADRRASVDAGAAYTTAITRYAQASFSLLRDILHRHNGLSGRLSIATYIPYKHWFMSPYCALQILNENFSDYYFGVRPEEASADRPEYHPGICYNPSLGLRLGYSFARSYTAVLGGELKFFDTAIRRSPIVEKKRSSSLQAAVLYNF